MDIINYSDAQIINLLQNDVQIAELAKNYNTLLHRKKTCQKLIRNVFVRILTICVKLDLVDTFGIFFDCYHATTSTPTGEYDRKYFKLVDWENIFEHVTDNKYIPYFKKILSCDETITLYAQNLISILPSDGGIECLEFVLNIKPFHELIDQTGIVFLDECFRVFGKQVYSVNIHDCDWDDMVRCSQRHCNINNRKLHKLIDKHYDDAQHKLKFDLRYQAARHFVMNHRETDIEACREIIPVECFQLVCRTNQQIHHPLFETTYF